MKFVEKLEALLAKLGLEAAGKKQFQHSHVTHERPFRINESRGTVFFKNKMANPRKTVTDDRSKNDFRVLLRADGVEKIEKTQSRSNDVQVSAHFVLVL